MYFFSGTTWSVVLVFALVVALLAFFLIFPVGPRGPFSVMSQAGRVVWLPGTQLGGSDGFFVFRWDGNYIEQYRR